MKAVYSNTLGSVTNPLTVSGLLGAAGSISFQLQRWGTPGGATMDPARILLVTDLTTGVIWYNVADSTNGGIVTTTQAGVLTVTWPIEVAATYDANGVLQTQGSIGRPYYKTTSDTIVVVYEAWDTEGAVVPEPGYGAVRGAPPATGLQTLGSDGSAAHPMLTDSSGTQIVGEKRFDELLLRLDVLNYTLMELVAASTTNPDLTAFSELYGGLSDQL